MDIWVETPRHSQKIKKPKFNKEQKTRIHIYRPPLFFFPPFELSPSYKYPMKNENFRKHVI